MKKLILFMALGFFAACSSDDEKTDLNERLLPTTISTNTVGEVKLDYTADNKVKTLNIADLIIYNFNYDGEKISSINALGDQYPGTYNFTYNGSVITSIERNGEVMPVVYNQPNNPQNMVNLNQNGDVESFFSDGSEVTLVY
ncbi:MAG: hypothetical protein EOP06_22610, partial [Proteobacteria bacterium]